jgi:hypothetical protein
MCFNLMIHQTNKRKEILRLLLLYYLGKLWALNCENNVHIFAGKFVDCEV